MTILGLNLDKTSYLLNDIEFGSSLQSINIFDIITPEKTPYLYREIKQNTDESLFLRQQPHLIKQDLLHHLEEFFPGVRQKIVTALHKYEQFLVNSELPPDISLDAFKESFSPLALMPYTLSQREQVASHLLQEYFFEANPAFYARIKPYTPIFPPEIYSVPVSSSYTNRVLSVILPVVHFSKELFSRSVDAMNVLPLNSYGNRAFLKKLVHDRITTNRIFRPSKTRPYDLSLMDFNRITTEQLYVAPFYLNELIEGNTMMSYIMSGTTYTFSTNHTEERKFISYNQMKNNHPEFFNLFRLLHPYFSFDSVSSFSKIEKPSMKML